MSGAHVDSGTTMGMMIALNKMSKWRRKLGGKVEEMLQQL
jgi:hypothetical protein